MEAHRGEGQPDEHTVTVKFKNVDLKTALAELLHAAGVSYVLRSGIKADTVTCELTNCGVEDALKAVLKGTEQDLSYRIEGNVFYIMPGA